MGREARELSGIFLRLAMKIRPFSLARLQRSDRVVHVQSRDLEPPGAQLLQQAGSRASARGVENLWRRGARGGAPGRPRQLVAEVDGVGLAGEEGDELAKLRRKGTATDADSAAPWPAMVGQRTWLAMKWAVRLPSLKRSRAAAVPSPTTASDSTGRPAPRQASESSRAAVGEVMQTQSNFEDCSTDASWPLRKSTARERCGGPEHALRAPSCAASHLSGPAAVSTRGSVLKQMRRAVRSSSSSAFFPASRVRRTHPGSEARGKLLCPLVEAAQRAEAARETVGLQEGSPSLNWRGS